MTGPTHKQFAVCGAFIAAMLIYKLGLSEVNYYLALPILILTSKYGALFPDVDHHWKNVHDKNVPNWIINKIIHSTGGKHRSWQTHSIDIVLVASLLTYFIPSTLYLTGRITSVNKEVMSIIMMGFMSGWISHTIADMLTSAGVRVLCFRKFKARLVPKAIGSLRFNTGHEWEDFNYKVVKWLNMGLGTICVVYPYINYTLVNNVVQVIK